MSFGEKLCAKLHIQGDSNGQNICGYKKAMQKISTDYL